MCAGFLPHNFHPARLFMGDSGSMLLGIVFSASTLTLTGQFNGTDLSSDGNSFFVAVLPVLLPVSLLMVPVADLVLAVVRRTRAGRSPFAPDKQHLHHRLLEIGHSQRRAVLIMWLWAGLVSCGAVLTSLYSGPWVWIGLGAMSAFTIALTFLVPVLKKPALLDAERRFGARGDFVIVFTSGRTSPVDRPLTPVAGHPHRTAADMTTESMQDTRRGASPLLVRERGGSRGRRAAGRRRPAGRRGPGPTGALAGGGLTLRSSPGIGLVNVAARVLPAASLLVALLTYTLQLLVGARGGPSSTAPAWPATSCPAAGSRSASSRSPCL